jgi:hypothetical protein
MSSSQKTVTSVSLVLSGVLILDSLNAGHAIIMLLIAGQIPGTDLFIPADTMLITLTGVFGVVCGRVTSRVIAYTQTLAPSSNT